MKKMGRWIVFVSFFALALPPVLACSEDSAPGSGTSSGASGTSGAASSAPASNCAARCQAKAEECGGPASACSQICSSATEADVTCIEGSSCDALARTEGKCPSTSSGGTSGSAGTSGGSSGTSGTAGCGSAVGACLSSTQCGSCASSVDGNGGYPSCCDKGSSGMNKVCRNRKCCLQFGDECTADADCCSNSAYTCKESSGGVKKCST